MNNGQMVEGYEGRLDYKSNDIVFNSRFNVSKVGENAGLRLCIYSTLRDRSKAQVKTPPPRRDVPLAWMCFIHIHVSFCQAGCTQLLLFQMKPLGQKAPAPSCANQLSRSKAVKDL